jgi:hypothetical protein
MKTDRIEYSIEHIIGLKGARVLADVMDFRVDIVAFQLGVDAPAAAAFPVSFILEQFQARIRHEIRNKYTKVQSIVPIDEGDHAS